MVIGLEMYMEILVVLPPVLVCFLQLYLHTEVTHTDVQNADFVNNNPASFVDAYFEFASIRIFMPKSYLNEE